MTPPSLPRVPHGIMFHHFHGGQHPRGQGAISVMDLNAILNHYADQLLPAEEWARRSMEGKLEPEHVCLTFDDALLCQVEIAAPILRRCKLTAFWFVYSSVLDGNLEYLEIFRYFRTVSFQNFAEFYEEFMAAVRILYPHEIDSALKDFKPDTYLSKHPFYSTEDRIFRFVRDCVLGVEQYNSVVLRMMRDRDVNSKEIANKLWMTPDHVRDLARTGHVVGLHSYSHPMAMKTLPTSEQRLQYGKNHAHLTRLLETAPIAMSHPCNSYSADTLAILYELGIKVGFRAAMSHIDNAGPLEWAREDHINIMSNLCLA